LDITRRGGSFYGSSANPRIEGTPTNEHVVAHFDARSNPFLDSYQGAIITRSNNAKSPKNTPKSKLNVFDSTPMAFSAEEKRRMYRAGKADSKNIGGGAKVRGLDFGMVKALPLKRTRNSRQLERTCSR
jgi:hypothetical protein